MFIDGTFENPELWKECCLLHDMAYWRGGTEERKQADLSFKACVEEDSRSGVGELDVRGGSGGRGAPFSDLVSLGLRLADWPRV